MVDMNDFGCELRALDAMNSVSLWMTQVAPHHEPMALDAINCLRL